MKINEVIMTKNVQTTVHQSQRPDPLSDSNTSSSGNNISSFHNAFKQHGSYSVRRNELPGFQNESDNLTDLDLNVPAPLEGR